MQERVLAIDERTYGRDHVNVASTLANLGSAYGHLDDHVKQREMLERAIAIKEKAHGPDHPSTKRSRERLAKLAS